MHLLCGIDDSAPGRNAAYVAGAIARRLAGRLASRLRASIVVTQVLPDRPRGGRPTSWQVYDAARRDGRAAAGAIADGFDLEYSELVGDPARMLARAPEDLDAALIVVGERRRRAVSRLLRPSVASAIARSVRRPVVVVPAAA